MIETLDIAFDATFKIERFGLTGAFIFHGNQNTFGKVSLVTSIRGDPFVIKSGSFFKNRWIRIKSNRGTVFFWATFGNLEFHSGLANVKFNVVRLAISVDFGGHMGGQSVHH